MSYVCNNKYVIENKHQKHKGTIIADLVVKRVGRKYTAMKDVNHNLSVQML